jgi:hypothetical protein
MATVRELIAELEKLDKDKKIVIDGNLRIFISSWKSFNNQEPCYGLDSYDASSTDIADYEILHKFPSID